MISDCFSDCVAEVDRYLREFPWVYEFVADRIRRVRDEMEAVRVILDTPPSDMGPPHVEQSITSGAPSAADHRTLIDRAAAVVEQGVDYGQVADHCLVNKPHSYEERIAAMDQSRRQMFDALVIVRDCLRVVRGDPAVLHRPTGTKVDIPL